MLRRDFVAGTFGTVASAALPARGQTKPSALALIGDRYHNADYIRTALTKTLVKGLGISIDFTGETETLRAENLAGHQLLILFRDGWVWPDGYPDQSTYAGYADFARRTPGGIVSDPPLPKYQAKGVPWITAEQGKTVRDFVSRGGGILFYHNVTYISPYNEDFRDVLGAVTRGHPQMRPFKVTIANKDHPITRDVHDFVVTDEQHFVTYAKDPKYVLIRSVNEDGLAYAPGPWEKEHLPIAPEDTKPSTTCEAGWAYDYGKGRVCYLAPGHMIVDLWNPEYEKLQQNAARWLLREI